MADNGRVDQKATRTIIIPKGVLSPEEVNVINIPQSSNNATPLLVIPRRDGRGVLSKYLPIWNDELSDGNEVAGVNHLVGSVKPCRFKSNIQDKTQTSLQQSNHDFSSSSIQYSSAEIDERENVFKNVYNAPPSHLETWPGVDRKMRSPQLHYSVAPELLNAEMESAEWSQSSSKNTCQSNCPPQHGTHSLSQHQSNHEFSLSSIQDSSAEMDEREANMFQNIMDGRYNVIRRMSPSPERLIPKFPEYRGGQGFRPRYLSSPLPTSQQQYMNDTSFPSTMYSKEFFTPELAGIKCSSGKNLPSRSSASKSSQPNATSNRPNATVNRPNATFDRPNATFQKPNATFGCTSDTCKCKCECEPQQSSYAYPNYSAAPFGIPIDTKFADSRKLPYNAPPSQIQTFPGAGRTSRSPQPYRSVSPQLVNAASAAGASQPSATFDYSYDTRQTKCKPQYGGSHPGRFSLRKQTYKTSNQRNPTSSNASSTYNPFNMSLDDRFADSSCVYNAPPSQIQTFPGAGRTSRSPQPFISTSPRLANAASAAESSQPSATSASPCVSSEVATSRDYSSSAYPRRHCPIYNPPPPSEIQTFPGASYTRRRPELGRSIAFPIDSAYMNSSAYTSFGEQTNRTCNQSSNAYSNYSAAPFGIPIDTKFANSSDLPYNAPPSEIHTFPGAGRTKKSPQMCRSIVPRPVRAPVSSNASLNYSAAPFGIPIDTKFANSSDLPHNAPPSQIHTFPGAGRTSRSPQMCRPIISRPVGTPVSSNASLNYSAAPFGIPIDAKFADSNYLPYYPPASTGQTYPQPTTRQGRPPLGTSLDGWGRPSRKVCANDDERSPRIVHMSSTTFEQVDDSPIDSESFVFDAPGGVSADLMDDILQDTSGDDSFEPPYISTPDNSSINVSLSFHQPPGFHDIRRAAGLNSLNACSRLAPGNIQGQNTYAGGCPGNVPSDSFMKNRTF